MNTTVAGFLQAVRQRGYASLQASTVVQSIARATESLVTVARRSRVVDALRWAVRMRRGSWLYRWFTADSERDAVVIDLRETVVTGRLLAVIDRAVTPLARTRTHARVRTVASALSERSAARPVTTVSVVALVGVLAVLLAAAALGSLTSNTLGEGLVAAAFALAGTRVRLSTDELSETTARELLAALLVPPERFDSSDRD